MISVIELVFLLCDMVQIGFGFVCEVEVVVQECWGYLQDGCEFCNVFCE